MEEVALCLHLLGAVAFPAGLALAGGQAPKRARRLATATSTSGVVDGELRVALDDPRARRPPTTWRSRSFSPRSR